MHATDSASLTCQDRQRPCLA